MSLPNEIVIDVTPEDAKNAKNYLSDDCLLGTAVKRQLNTESVHVGSVQITINDEWFKINEWGKIRNAYNTHDVNSSPNVETPFQVTLTKI